MKISTGSCPLDTVAPLKIRNERTQLSCLRVEMNKFLNENNILKEFQASELNTAPKLLLISDLSLNSSESNAPFDLSASTDQSIVL